ncbi:probable cytochrome P450 6a14 isoform X2 [Neocloeon triangulifer]|uniref:probable cytochrome P450 6a14 isoform X2 n=1 Tax=Neocloeon triangulifer TaxID=2078957 RepID=UPI00286FAA9A|nr:probable cytochrome P450 6a14 isoform X2 [Neocloeon triangulifer]
MDRETVISILFSPWCIAVGTVTALYYYQTKNFTYWQNMGVPFQKPHLLFGNTGKRITFKISYAEMLVELYQQFDGEKIAGIYEGRLPRLMIRDPELLRQVMVRDFDSFVDRAVISIHPNSYEENMMLSLRGSHWKAVRSVATPIFSSGKIKAMSHLVTKCADQISEYLDEYVIPKGGEVDAKELFGRFTLDVIGTCAFGVQCNSLQDPDAEFVRVISKFMEMSIWMRVRLFFSLLICGSATLARLMGVHFMNQETVRYIAGLVFNSKKERVAQNSQRVDFLKLMFDAQAGKLQKAAEQSKELFEKDAQLATAAAHEEKVPKTVLTDEMVVGQCLLFLLAGYDTSSTLLSFAAYELALNPEIQEKAREEVLAAVEKSDGELSYDTLNDMPYLENVLMETLRRHPPVSRVERSCTVPSYTIPGTSAVLKKGDIIMIPIRGLSLDPKHFPDPLKFNPDRFLPEERAKRSPYVFMPFGSGPRNCIGMRFAMMSTRLAMATLLKSYKFETCPKTQVPYSISKGGILLKAKDGVWVKISRI